jgi:hypothetical protein
MKNLLKLAIALLAFIGSGTLSVKAQTKQEIVKMQQQLKQLTAADALVQKHLKTFDTLDFTVFSGQQWARFHESHGKDIKVFWPDGHITTRIKQHPIRFGSGNFTAVTGVFQGTFTKPMPIGNGKFIQPTGKKFNFPMATIGIWKDGVMIEEHLFWDNKTYLDQIGLGK